MEILSMLLLGAGLLVSLVGGIWFLIVSFQESVLWGLGCLIVPFVSLIFLVMHWDKAGKPFLIQLGGAALVICGSVLGGDAGPGTP